MLLATALLQWHTAVTRRRHARAAILQFHQRNHLACMLRAWHSIVTANRASDVQDDAPLRWHNKRLLVRCFDAWHTHAADVVHASRTAAHRQHVLWVQRHMLYAWMDSMALTRDLVKHVQAMHARSLLKRMVGAWRMEVQQRAIDYAAVCEAIAARRVGDVVHSWRVLTVQQQQQRVLAAQYLCTMSQQWLLADVVHAWRVLTVQQQQQRATATQHLSTMSQQWLLADVVYAWHVLTVQQQQQRATVIQHLSTMSQQWLLADVVYAWHVLTVQQQQQRTTVIQHLCTMSQQWLLADVVHAWRVLTVQQQQQRATATQNTAMQEAQRMLHHWHMMSQQIGQQRSQLHSKLHAFVQHRRMRMLGHAWNTWRQAVNEEKDKNKKNVLEAWNRQRRLGVMKRALHAWYKVWIRDTGCYIDVLLSSCCIDVMLRPGCVLCSCCPPLSSHTLLVLVYCALPAITLSTLYIPLCTQHFT